jgi:hypothetical protein
MTICPMRCESGSRTLYAICWDRLAAEVPDALLTVLVVFAGALQLSTVVTFLRKPAGNADSCGKSGDEVVRTSALPAF